MLNKKNISHTFKNALKSKGLVTGKDTALIFYDQSFIEKRINELNSIFPQNAIHAIAIKANPVLSILKFINKLGAGAEAASLPEIHLALKAGFSPDRIVFDSPAKTRDEILFSLKKGININADSFEELEIIKEILPGVQTKSNIGVRINPQVGTGKIKATSVAGKYSKFGIPINEFRKDLQKYFAINKWLRGVHLHTGSQGISPDMLLKGARTIYDFVTETNSLLLKNFQEPISRFDIGGGLPVSYLPGERPVTIKEYYSGLKKTCPDLFSERFRIITEFGRYIYANAGWAVSKVEYVKRSAGINTAVIHLGADMFLRKAYMPGKWHHEIFVMGKNGNIKAGTEREFIIAGPLCFAGDMLAKNINLPEIERGDFVVIQDVGAYTLSMWSRYNSRQMPKIIGYKNDGKTFAILKRRENIKKIIDFWG